MTVQQQRRLTSIGLLGFGFAMGILLGVQEGAGIQMPDWLRFGVIAAAVIAGTVFSLRWWRLLDEVAREAHKFAWYWGGSAGIAFGGLMIILVDADKITLPARVGDLAGDSFAAGAVMVMVAQLVGYLVAWVGWWWSRR